MSNIMISKHNFFSNKSNFSLIIQIIFKHYFNSNIKYFESDIFFLFAYISSLAHSVFLFGSPHGSYLVVHGLVQPLVLLRARAAEVIF